MARDEKLKEEIKRQQRAVRLINKKGKLTKEEGDAVGSAFNRALKRRIRWRR